MEFRKDVVTYSVLVGIILSLVALVYTGFTKDLEKVESKVEAIDEKKVDNDTLKMMIQHTTDVLQMQLKQSAKQFERVWKELEEIKREKDDTHVREP